MNDLTALLLGMSNHGEAREKTLRLPFAYPGSKADYLKDILPHIPYGSGYGEAFGGSGAVLLNREPSKLEVYNDRYGGITCFFRVVRDRALYNQFMERLGAMTLHSREEFLWCKATWDNCEDTVERAARWYYTIRFAVNGKAKSTFGRSLGPAVRFADRLAKSLPLFGPLHGRLQTVTIENQDWRQLIEDFDRKGFIWYLDPTYLDCFPGAYEHELSIADHKELMVRIPHLQGFVAVSSYDGPATRAIYDVKGVWDDCIVWERKTTALTQAFNSENNLINLEQTSSRETKKELLWIRKAR